LFETLALAVKEEADEEILSRGIPLPESERAAFVTQAA
jgi:hypothetical protein